MCGGVNLCVAAAQHLLFARTLTQRDMAKGPADLTASEMRQRGCIRVLRLL